MPASLLPADVLPPFDEPCVFQRAPQHLFERRVPAKHPPRRPREHEIGRGRA